MLKFLTSVLVFFYLSLTTFSSTINKKDSIRILNLISEGIVVSDNASEARNLFQNALRLSQKHNWNYGMAVSQKELALIYKRNKNYKEAINVFRKALKNAQESKDLSEIANISLNLGITYNFTNNKTSSIFYLDKAQKYFRESFNLEGLFHTYLTMSMVYLSNNEHYQSLLYANKAVRISQTLKINEYIFAALNNLGQINYILNKPKKAVENYKDAIKIATNENDESALFLLYIKTGTIYRNIENHNNALRYFIKANELAFKTNSSESLIKSLIETGKTYKLLKNYEKSINYLLRAKTLAEKINSFSDIIELNFEVSEVFILTEQFHKALIYLDQNNRIAKQLKNKDIEAKSLLNIARLYYLKENFHKSIQILEQSVKVAEAGNDKAILLEINLLLSEIYQKLGKFDKSFFSLKESYKILENDQNTKELEIFKLLQNVFEIKTSVNKGKNHNLLLELEKNKKTIASQKKTALITFLVYLLLTITLIFIFVNIIRKRNKTIADKNNEIKETNNAIIEISQKIETQKREFNNTINALNLSIQKTIASEANLKEANSTKDKLLSIISHDLRGPFATIASFVRYVKREIKTLSKKEIFAMTEELDITAAQISNLFENLIQWTLNQSGKLKYNPQVINIDACITDTVSLLKSTSDSKNIVIEVVKQPNIFVYADKTMLSTVLRNLISNAIKFSHQKNKIIVSVEKDSNHAKISVQDFGIGISEEKLNELRSQNKNHIKVGTMYEKGNGIGLMVSDEFLKLHSSNLQIESEIDKGTTFSFLIKISKQNQIEN